MIKILLLATAIAFLVRSVRSAFVRVSAPAPEPSGRPRALELRRCEECGEYSLPGGSPGVAIFLCAACRRSGG